jgi:hypothetical protein
MLAVLSLFLLPIGGGIPAGVLLARSSGLAWPLTAGLYLASDLLLALAFEPILRGLVNLGSRSPYLVRLSLALQIASRRFASKTAGSGAGPLSLVAVSFGIDPMTGRAAALAAGHGILAGWAFAIAGDMLYYGVVAAATLQLNAYLKSPGTTVAVILGAMVLVPLLVRRFRSRAATA